MKKMIILALLTAAICLPAFAQESDVTYIDGWVDLKDSSGEVYELFIGDRVLTGDTVITGDDGVAELEPQSGSRIIIKPGTVFSIKEQTVNGKKYPVASTTLGQVAFKFNRMTQEPLITTMSTVAGVRGTEFTVFAGADGSSMIIVDSGAVEVTSEGESVYLEPDEGVEVQPGKTPGDKFQVMGRAIDFADWNSSKVKTMMADPAVAVSDLSDQLKAMIAEMEEWAGYHEANADNIISLRAEMNTLFTEGQDAEAQKFYDEQLRPQELTSLKYVMNYRYYALSALSMRQHVLSGFYIKMKTAYIADRENPVYTEFQNKYQTILSEFEKRAVPNLVEADY